MRKLVYSRKRLDSLVVSLREGRREIFIFKHTRRIIMELLMRYIKITFSNPYCYDHATKIVLAPLEEYPERIEAVVYATLKGVLSSYECATEEEFDKLLGYMVRLKEEDYTLSSEEAVEYLGATEEEIKALNLDEEVDQFAHCTGYEEVYV